MSEIKLILSNDIENEILEKRAKNLAKDIIKEDKDEALKRNEFLVFSINKTRYAVSKQYLEDVYNEVSPTKVPFAPTFIVGVANVRGEILSLNDIALFLGNEPIEKRSVYQMIRVHKENLTIGILVDNIDSIIELRHKDIFPISSDKNSKMSKYLLGVTRNMINVLDFEILLSDESLVVN